jgi:hypothetical protein
MAAHAPAAATHALTLYRHSSGALVFSAGTIQWSWGLDGIHDMTIGAPDDLRMQQATVNLLMDMGVTPATPRPGLDTTPAPADVAAPHTTIVSPVTGSDVAPNGLVQISGTASDAAGVVAGVEVSVDGGQQWHPAVGRDTWTYSWSPTATGVGTIMARSVDDSGNLESPAPSVAVTVVNPNCPCTIWDPAVSVPAVINTLDDSQVELGVKFRAGLSGFITGVRFYKSAANTGTHVGNLWSSSDAARHGRVHQREHERLAGGHFLTPVAVVANAVYVASYHTNTGHYSSSAGYFAAAGVDRAPLHAIQRDEPQRRTNTRDRVSTLSFNASNYWVDVVYYTTLPADTTPPTVTVRCRPCDERCRAGRSTAAGRWCALARKRR